ncbi:MAG: carboxypeptidase-like regulatory domain-containing protein [Myxococcota bacterium]|nr:carboxypeptidase-like regulatory domain-containing protein [Myxococcota bacterium]
MRRRTLSIIALALAVLAVGVWTVVGSSGGDAGTPVAKSRHRSVGRGFADAMADAMANGRARSAVIPWRAPAARDDGSVTISGSVLEHGTTRPVGNVEVVFRGASGEETTTARADGTYALDLPAGVYRAFVRDDVMLSVGAQDRIRLPGAASADTAGAPDEGLMPMIVATRDAAGLDLWVMRAGTLSGRVLDRAGRPIANAVLRATLHVGHGVRPTLGTDITESGPDGSFELRLPAGGYGLEATHARFAGLRDHTMIEIQAGDVTHRDLTLVAGCVVSGRVVGAGNVAANEGAIERQWGATELEFAPSGKIESDGTFWWSSTEEVDIVLRAWPWKAPPSPSRRFSCRDGARFTDVVFQLPDRRPDIEGVLVDHAGAPVAFAHLDLTPLDPGGIAQQERTDGSGRFGVFLMPAGRYAITAYAPGRGTISTTITSPVQGARLALSGVGRIEGTTLLLQDGSLDVMLGACLDGGGVELPRERRLVAVRNSRFTIDEVPACDLQFVASWRGDAQPGRVTVPAGGVARVELRLGPPRAKTASGVVRDRQGRPQAGVDVTSTEPTIGGTVATDAVTTDAAGRFEIATVSGATLEVVSSRVVGEGTVGLANIDREQVDIVVRERTADDDERDDDDRDSVH